MAETIVIHGTTRDEVVAKAQDLINTIDPYRQPHVEGTWQKAEGDWIAYVKYWGLD